MQMDTFELTDEEVSDLRGRLKMTRLLVIVVMISVLIAGWDVAPYSPAINPYFFGP